MPNIINATSASSAHVMEAYADCVDGDIIQLPPGDATWLTGSVTFDRAVTLRGYSSTLDSDGCPTACGNVIDVSGTFGQVTFNITKQAAGRTIIQDIEFTATNVNHAVHPVAIDGDWLTTYPVIFQRVRITCITSTMIHIGVPGGVIFSKITFTGEFNDFLFTIKHISTLSWDTADSMGDRDTYGKLNAYVEDSTFNGGSNGILDGDDGARIVFRNNRLFDSGGFNSHGADTSQYGMRHFEIYGNDFNYNPSGPANINFYILIRGGTGVIYNNDMESLYSMGIGDKKEITMWIRGAEDPIVMGDHTCSAVSYPAYHQLGQNNNGSADFTDPIWFWGNTGAVDPGGPYVIEVAGGWVEGNPCGFDWNTFFLWGRDGINTSVGSVTLDFNGGSVDGSGGTAKPGYTAFAYPHPLLDVSSTPTVRGRSLQFFFPF